MIHPLTPPEPLLSETGRRLLDLNKRDLSLREIARHVGCVHKQLQMLRDNPAYVASRLLVDNIETFHENVITGFNPWGRMMNALIWHGWTYETVATRVGVTPTYLRAAFNSPLRIPSDDLGRKIEGLYARHVAPLLRR